jgi:diaminopimelate decarboxylase
MPAARALGLELIVEPGRFLVGNAGVLVTRVLDRKHSGGKEYVVTDAGMNDLLRPSHYQAFHRIEAAAAGRGRVVADIVGPVCESGDFLALDRDVDDVHPGDLLVVHSAGAYGFVMASNYNARPRPAEVLVDGDRFAVARGREEYEDLVRHETPTPDWRTA